MTCRIKLTLNDDVLLSGELGAWQRKNPVAWQHLIKPGRKPGNAGGAVYMSAAMAAVLDAYMIDVDTHIDVKTSDTGWSMSVTRTPVEAGVT